MDIRWRVRVHRNKAKQSDEEIGEFDRDNHVALGNMTSKTPCDVLEPIYLEDL